MLSVPAEPCRNLLMGLAFAKTATNAKGASQSKLIFFFFSNV
jgi:hypothetical protein